MQRSQTKLKREEQVKIKAPVKNFQVCFQRDTQTVEKLRKCASRVKYLPSLPLPMQYLLHILH